jgi:hypothetical protein
MARSHADIVEEICINLRQWKRRGADVRAEVEKRIALLVEIAAKVDQWPRGADVRKAVRGARKALDRLRKTLAGKPLEPFVVATLPSDVGRRAKAISDLEQAAAIVVDNKYFDQLDEALALKESIKSPDPRSNPVQWLCAETADALIHELSTKPATGTAEGSLQAIASLLFEAVTGKPDQNLKRPVDGMIRSWRGLDGMGGGRGRPKSGPIERDK